LWQRTHQRNAGDEIHKEEGHVDVGETCGEGNNQTYTKMTGYSWRELEIKSHDRRLGKTVVNGLCSSRDDGHKKKNYSYDTIYKLD